MATVIWTDGKLYDVADADVPRALADGAKLADPTRVAAADQPLRAGLEGVARGASFGFAEPILVEYAKEFDAQDDKAARAAVQARREENPIAATAGEIAGGVGVSALTGGGVSALVGGGLKGAAVEGSLMGLGEMYRESVIEDTDLTGRKAAAGLLGGALGGGGTYGAFKLLGKGVSAGVKKLGGMTTATSLEQMGKDLKWSALTQSNAKYARTNATLKDDIINLADRLGVNALDDASLAKAQDYVDGNGALAKEYEQFLAKMDSHAPIALNDPKKVQIVDAIKQELATKYGKNPAYKGALSAAEGQLDEFLATPNQSWTDVKRWQTAINKVLPQDPMATVPANKEVLDTMREKLLDVIGDNAEQVATGMKGQFNRIRRDFATGYGLEEMLARRAASVENSAGPLGLGSLRTLGGMAVGGAVGGIPGALLAGVAERQMMKRGGFIAGSILQKLGKSPTLKGVGNAFHKRVGQMLSVDPSLLGRFRTPIEQAFARGADELLSTHVQLASDPAYLATMGMSPESPGEVEAAGARMAHVDAMVNAAAEYDADVDGGIDAVLGAKPGRKSTFSVPSTKDFDSRLAQVRAIARNPETVFENVPPEFLGATPATSGAAAASIVQAAQYLYEKAPKDPYEGMPESLKPAWKPSAEEVARWYRYVDAVEGGPKRLLQLATQGTLAKEHVEAVQATQPGLFADLQVRLTERLSEWKKPVAYSTKVSLSQFLGPQVLGLSPQAAQVIQQTFQPPQPSGGMGRPDGRQQVSQEKNLATQGQKLEAR